MDFFVLRFLDFLLDFLLVFLLDFFVLLPPNRPISCRDLGGGGGNVVSAVVSCNILLFDISGNSSFLGYAFINVDTEAASPP